MLTVIATIIFAFSAWAIFSRKFKDGIIAKHCLTFAAICAALVIRDGSNTDAFAASLCLLLAGLVYWAIKHWNDIRNWSRRTVA